MRVVVRGSRIANFLAIALTLMLVSSGCTNTSTTSFKTPKERSEEEEQWTQGNDHEPEIRSPRNVHIARGGSSVQLAWNPVPEATHYEVYYETDGYLCDADSAFSTCDLLADNLVESVYDLTNVVPSVDYVSVLAVVDRTSESLTIAWDREDKTHNYWVRACDNEECSFFNESAAYYEFLPVRFQIYQGHEGQTYEAPIEVEHTLAGTREEGYQYTYTGLQPNTVYYYRVAVCYASDCLHGSSEQADVGFAAGLTESDGPVNIPSLPTGFRGEKIEISLGGDNAKVTWNAVEGATYYEVARGMPFNLIVQISAPLLEQWQFVSPNRGTFGSYQSTSYKVRACNKAGCSPYTEVVRID